ncbi:hypothetical protein ACVEIO_009565 [Klebsiella aerogenes]|uniref:hypothetical protein n=1 Tax=Klebsiella TaxID=570 RepID=UPI0010553F31|nr:MULTISPECIES: hypothetical protein [Klebsiella]HBX2114109.1 hypothetical protein [Klebsiella aerogenes]
MNRLQYFVAIALFGFSISLPSLAGPILGGVVGNAKGEVSATCTPFCQVTNKSSKKVRAILALALGASISKDLNPGETFTFTMDGKTFDSAFGISVNYI